MTSRLKETVVLVLFAQQPQGAWRAGAGKVVDQVVARAAVGAGLVGTVVHVELTVHTLVARRTRTPGTSADH